jgi:hypothetical protein
MKSRRRVVFVVVLFTLVTSTAVLFAQHNHTASSDVSPTMMQGCQKHRSEMGALLDQMSKTLADGKELRSVEEMRAAMEKAQSQLAEVKQHMDMCPMAKDGMMHDSDGHMQGRKCMSDQQKTEGKDQAPK